MGKRNRWEQFSAPSRTSRKLYRTWAIWVALVWLDQQAVDGRLYVPASEFRAILESTIDPRELDNLLLFLRRHDFVGRLNSKGRQNRRYYLTDEGKTALVKYAKQLEERYK